MKLEKILDLRKAKDAREFIKDFHIKGKKPNWVKTSVGRKIYLDKMTDEEAIAVAHMLSHVEESELADLEVLH